MRNFSPLFYNGKEIFFKNISLTQETQDLMRISVAKIKTCINEAISKEYGKNPSFMTQGSAGYKTQNKPCYTTQEVDHDIGCYLPFSYLEETGKPSEAANLFYDTVDNALEAIVKQNNWIKIDKTKTSCSRAVINTQLHIDIPLYSVPDKEFSKIIERSIESRKSMNFSDTSLLTKEVEESWDDFNFTKVLLGQRDGQWRESDPRKINMFFEDTFEKKGEQLRRLCRYLKAWRDYKWQEGGPKSIYLMFLAEDLFIAENNTGDDLTLLEILGKIPERIKMPLYNKAETDYSHTEELKIEDEDKNKLTEYAKAFAIDLEKALTDTSITDEESCQLIRKHLGKRFPLIKIVQHEMERSIEYIRSTPASNDNTSRPLTRTRAG